MFSSVEETIKYEIGNLAMKHSWTCRYIWKSEDALGESDTPFPGSGNARLQLYLTIMFLNLFAFPSINGEVQHGQYLTIIIPHVDRKLPFKILRLLVSLPLIFKWILGKQIN